ncbi:hypothetical protein QJS66_20940 [Kocuria rhizophila]|nr:hypothetical protein QJS66_20940 [Kocuria rhizophila]
MILDRLVEAADHLSTSPSGQCCSRTCGPWSGGVPRGPRVPGRARRAGGRRARAGVVAVRPRSHDRGDDFVAMPDGSHSCAGRESALRCRLRAHRRGPARLERELATRWARDAKRFRGGARPRDMLRSGRVRAGAGPVRQPRPPWCRLDGQSARAHGDPR